MQTINCKKHRWSAVIDAMVIWPAALLGIVAMINAGNSVMIWGQQVAGVIVAVLLCCFRRHIRNVSSVIWASALMVVLAATLLFPSVGGAKRWVDLGPININAAMLVLPVMLVLFDEMKFPWPFLIAASVILCMQPDLSQLAAFSLGALPVVYKHRKNRVVAVISVVLLLALGIRCVIVPTELEAVAYCEGILNMLGEMAVPMQWLGYLALMMIPGYFAWYFFKRSASISIACLAIYYAVSIFFGFTGAYPVPFMGFGFSQFIGYGLAMMLVPSLKEANMSQKTDV